MVWALMGMILSVQERVDDPRMFQEDTTTSVNAADAIDIAAGFIVDDAGNAATTDVSDATSVTYTETSTDGDQYSKTDNKASDDVDDSDHDRR